MQYDLRDPTSLLEPTVYLKVRVPVEVVVNNTKTVTIRVYRFVKFNERKVIITTNGAPYSDDPIGNPDGQYNGKKAQEILDSFCPHGVEERAKPQPRMISASTQGISGSSTDWVALGDFNQDGIADSAVITSTGFNVNIFNAAGKSTSKSYALAKIGSTIISADFTGDGIDDLAVVTDPDVGGGSVIPYIGKGDGTFTGGASYPAGYFPFYLAAGDFNQDGKQDLAVSVFPSGNTAGTVAVLLGNGNGTFAAAANYPVGPAPATIVSADFTGDGIADIVVLDARSDITNKVWVLRGKGDGTFLPAVSTATGTNAGYLHYADFDHDGYLDLLIADSLSSTMVRMQGKGDGTFGTPQRFLSSTRASSFGLLPLDDGNTALLTRDNASDLAELYFIAANGEVVSPSVLTVGRSLAAVAAGDLNGDGLPDVAFTDYEANALFVMPAANPGKFAAPASIPVPASPGPLILGDLDHDGKADAIVATTSGLVVLLGAANGLMGGPRVFGNEPFGPPAVSDFNGDGKLDVASPVYSAGQVSVFLGNGDGTLQSAKQVSFAAGLSPLNVAAADVNGDGIVDLVVLLGPSSVGQPGTIAILAGKGDGAFQSPSSITLPGPLIKQASGRATVAGLAVGDLNGDSKPDIVTVVTIDAKKQIAVMLGKGDGTFTGATLTATNTAPPQIVIADVNRDSHPDLLLTDCCGLSEASFVLGKGDGAFYGELPFPSGPDPVGIATADFDGNGHTDLAIAGRMGAPDLGTLTIVYGAFPGISAEAPVTVVSSANPNGSGVAPGSLATAYGTNLATGVAGSTSLPLPTTFGGASISITDSKGAITAAPLLYVSPTQVNFYIPPNVATGPASVTFTSGDGTKSTATVQIAAVAPGVFQLNAAGLAAANALIYSGSSVVLEDVYAVDAGGAIVAKPVSLGSDSDLAYLQIYGTGFQAAGTSGVQVKANGVPVDVAYAGAQGQFTGLDQLNVLLPRSLAGKGNLTLQVTANGIDANPVNITIQ